MAGVTFELEACPHCGSDAQIRDHAVYRYQCMACGNPRLPVDRRWLRTPPEVTRRLGSVRRHHIKKGLWNGASWMAGILAVVTALFGVGTAWSLDFAAAGWSFVSALIAVPLIFALFSRLTAMRHEREVTQQLEEAWRTLAAFFFTSTQTTRSLEDVRAAFGVDSDSALKLLAEGEVASYLSRGGDPLDERDRLEPAASDVGRFRVEADQRARTGQNTADQVEEPDHTEWDVPPSVRKNR